MKLLKNCYDIILDDGKVIVVEAILPIVEAVLPIIPKNNAAWKSISEIDVVMILLYQGGKERIEQEFMELATGTGFSDIRYESYAYAFCVMEFFK